MTGVQTCALPISDAMARVYRTRDAGASWEPLGDGLPQRDAFLTVLRDGDRKSVV